MNVVYGMDLESLQEQVGAQTVDRYGLLKKAAATECLDTSTQRFAGQVRAAARDALREQSSETLSWFMETSSIVPELTAFAGDVNCVARRWVVRRCLKTAEVAATIFPGVMTYLDPRDVEGVPGFSFGGSNQLTSTASTWIAIWQFAGHADTFGMSPEQAWLERLYALDARHHIDEAIDEVYEKCLSLLDQGDSERIGQILSLVDVNRLGVEAALAFLTITVPASQVIPKRPELFKRIRARITILRGLSDADRLLEGLG